MNSGKIPGHFWASHRETSLSLFGDDLPNGATGAFGPVPDLRVNVSAVVEPANAFTLGEVRRNKKKGKATLTVSVPNPAASPSPARA